MLIEVVGDTVFFLRRENSPTELIPGVHGFGHTFPEAYTTWASEVGGSESHQRVLSYTFAALKFLVRFEADGYLPDVKPVKTAKWLQGTNYSDNTHESLLPALVDTTISQNKSSDLVNGNLTVSHGGTEVPQAAIFDLKTRSMRKKR